MLTFKNVGMLIKRNSKIICSYNRLRACTFFADPKSSCACYMHDYEHAHNLHRPKLVSLQYLGEEFFLFTNSPTAYVHFLLSLQYFFVFNLDLLEILYIFWLSLIKGLLPNFIFIFNLSKLINFYSTHNQQKNLWFRVVVLE